MGISGAALLWALPVCAQEGAASRPQSTGQNDWAAGDIVVTAQKTGAQSVLSVPLTITAIDSGTLENAGVKDLSDISKIAPSVNLVEAFGRSANFLSMRGVSSTETGTPTVQVFVDGFTTGTSAGISTTLFDIERVEVLEGPQATLYGANAIGGVINYITKKPGNDVEGSLKLQYGEYDETSVQGSISGPVIEDKLFASAAVAYHRQDGYLDDLGTGDEGINSEKDVSARGALRAVLGDTTIDASATYTYTNDGCSDCSYIPRDYDLNLAPSAPFDTSLRDGLVDVNAYDLTVDQGEKHYFRRHANTEVLTIEHDFGGLTLTSISGYGQVDQSIAFDLSRAASRNPNPVYATYVVADSQVETVSEELRLAGGSKGRFNWLVGGYYLHLAEDSTTYLGYAFPNPIGIERRRTENLAAFVNAEVPIGPHFLLSGGLRFDHQTVDNTNSILLISGKAKSNEWLPRLTAQYAFDSGLMIYATASKGYKSGGVNVATPDPSVPRTYAPEFLWNYEGGIKGRLFDGRATFSLSGFHIDWTDRQVQLLDSSGLYAYQANLGKSTIDGAQLSTNVNVVPGFDVNAAVTYLDGKIDRYLDLSGVSQFYGIDPDLADNELPNAPKLRFTVSPQLVLPVFGSFDLRARADVSYTSARYFDAQNLLRQDPYTLVNLYVGIERENFEIGVYANNVFDEGYHGAGSLTTVGPLLSTGAPRMVGVRSQIKL
ncbi:hypothetical protein B2G71_21675 [Novosphingobium sp. PC22D]|uniref:TonB-dependent receptor n=1 Tax=Novosphingobium sp. PC22D TaxID=1962403 RepID=UPI000BFABB83|nr:TonB-dependent receptor [Novosphingobium sp. PC22D]PEQ10589.1 hypothetical protein B2G71_21675 [Novosphingobium sp. PC22D]